MLRTLHALYRYLSLPFRVVAVLLWLFIGLVVQAVLFAWLSRMSKLHIIQAWSRGLLRCVGVRLQVHGYSHHRLEPHSRMPTALVVSNHISWLDILVILASLPVVFVAKSEIRSWPILGWMVAMAGTCFIHRERKSALRGIHGTLTDHLRAGQSVCVFPEGTTGLGDELMPFHAGIFESAIAAQVPVIPVQLAFSNPAAAYVGDISLLHSVLSILLTPNLSAQVHVLTALPTEGQTRQTISQQAHSAIAAALHKHANHQGQHGR